MLMTGTSWGLRAMKFVWHKMHQLWIEYTCHRHSPTTGPTPTQLCLLHRITHFQQSYLQIYPYHSHQFFLNEAFMHTLPTGQLKNWLPVLRTYIWSHFLHPQQLMPMELKKLMLVYFQGAK